MTPKTNAKIIIAAIVLCCLNSAKIGAQTYDENCRRSSFCTETCAEAIKICSQAISNNPGSHQNFSNRARIFSNMDDLSSAVIDLTHAINIEANEPNYFLNRGHYQRNLGQHELATADYATVVEIATSLINKNPNDTAAYLTRAFAWQAKKMPANAIQDLKKNLEIDPKNSLARTFLGINLKNNGDLNEAIEVFTQAIKLNQNDSMSYSLRGTVWEKIGNIKNAMADHDQAIKMNSKNPIFYIARGESCNAFGYLDRALDDFNQALDLKPIKITNAQAYKGRANTRAMKQDYESAIRDLDLAASSNKYDATIYFQRSQILLKMNNIERALDDLKATISLDPSHTEAAVKLKMLLR